MEWYDGHEWRAKGTPNGDWTDVVKVTVSP
jgi:hypothetical protein